MTRKRNKHSSSLSQKPLPKRQAVDAAGPPMVCSGSANDETLFPTNSTSTLGSETYTSVSPSNPRSLSHCPYGFTTHTHLDPQTLEPIGFQIVPNAPYRPNDTQRPAPTLEQLIHRLDVIEAKGNVNRNEEDNNQVLRAINFLADTIAKNTEQVAKMNSRLDELHEAQADLVHRVDKLSQGMADVDDSMSQHVEAVEDRLVDLMLIQCQVSDQQASVSRMENVLQTLRMEFATREEAAKTHGSALEASLQEEIRSIASAMAGLSGQLQQMEAPHPALSSGHSAAAVGLGTGNDTTQASAHFSQSASGSQGATFPATMQSKGKGPALPPSFERHHAFSPWPTTAAGPSQCPPSAFPPLPPDHGNGRPLSPGHSTPFYFTPDFGHTRTAGHHISWSPWTRAVFT
ncbi:hypothetical protein CC85DRAFT_129809 [Cutaneotrichosporon oleaginosum]|uniref:Uncharacterized protein n=2 Tax=Cutaneotrichosporon oleaginosum TaxID=879819 RepID=A0A0J0XIY7_9TREE|nr:uncharacterized protein CC85DRAFT_129809 [Cutaneotrichosporon oleaginosum]KLT41041.1 hypothetical protein CC85DRAFT_129809 [Cutaneotrichosporon oleaginosum]